MYYLYFIEEEKFKFYGSGDMSYIMELLNDYLNICKMYGKKEVSFKVTTEVLD